MRPAGTAKWEARCPAHEDNRASLSVGVGKADRALIHCHAGCTTAAVLAKIGMRLNCLFPDTQPRRIVATYPYTDADGVHLFDVVRFEPKDFRQRRADGQWTMDGVPRVLFHLPRLIATTGTVVIVEGEKDVLNLEKLFQQSSSTQQWAATCNPGGAGKWSKLADDSALEGRELVIIADKDHAGRVHAREVADRFNGAARIIELPVKDASDWIAAGGTVEQLLELIDNPPPPAEEPTSDGCIPLGGRDPDGRLVLSPRKTLPTAEAYLKEFHDHPDARTLNVYAGEPHVWRNNRYGMIEAAAIEQRLLSWLHAAVRYVLNRKTNEMQLIDFESNPTTVRAAQQSVFTQAYIPRDVEPPAWLPPRAGDPPAERLLVCKSMNLDLETNEVIPASPRLFVTASLDFDYVAEAPDPVQWLAFLNDVFSGDQASIFLLQQWFGYCLTMNTRHQKMLLMIGPKRSGKGTVARVLKQLVGVGNVAGPTVGSLSGQFGLQPLIGKSLAIVSDARFGGDGIGAVVERLLCISGEDTLTIDRKYNTSVTMKLPTRFCFLTNEAPRLTDSSGALAGRFMILRFTKSFFGREDINLTERLLAELPSILEWAIEGWKRLNTQQRFEEPAISADEVEEMQDLFSPISAYARDRLRVHPDERVYIEHLFKDWCDWCTKQGRTHPGTMASFGRDLRAAVPGIARHQSTGGRFYSGIGVIPAEM